MMLDLLAFKATNVPAQNLVSNGDFSNGTTGWVVSLGAAQHNITVVDGVYQVTKTSDGSLLSVAQSGGVIGGHKYYLAGFIKGSSVMNFTGNEFVYIPNTPGQGALGAVTTDWVRKSFIRIPTNTSTSYKITLFSGINIPLGETLYTKNILMIDLTEVFGDGYEPTKEEMDFLIDRFPDAWFGGTRNLFNAKRIMQLYFKEIREIRNAITSLGGGS